MRYCNQCHKITSGEPLFCNFCGRSYDFKLCPHRHPNPRIAEVCSTCGSRELSIPHPHVPLWLEVSLRLLSALPGLVLLAVSIVFLLGLINAFLTSPRLQAQFLALGLVLALLWYLYLRLPHFLRHLLTRIFHRSKDTRGGGHGH